MTNTLQILGALKIGQTSMQISEYEIVVKPKPFAHLSMQSFINDINLRGIGNLDSVLTLTVLYEGYSPSVYGGSNTTAVYLTLPVYTNTDFTKILLDTMYEQMLNLKLEFKCIIKFCILI